jgi:hypothetical protein
MENYDPAEVYRKRIKEQQELLEILLKKRSRLGWVRLIVFILTIIITYQVFVMFGLWGILAVSLGIALLLFLVSIDVNNNQKIETVKTLIRINNNELDHLNHHYHQEYDGSGYTPALHDYANDLDLFGRSSLYQFISRCYTDPGRSLLAAGLLHPLSPEKILQRQEAIKEMAPMVAWRQELQSLSMQATIRMETVRTSKEWIAEEETVFKNQRWKIFVNIYSFITMSSLVAAIIGFIPGSIFLFLFAVYFSFSIILSRNTIKPYIQLGGIVKEIGVLEKMVESIEKPDFKSLFIQGLRKNAAPGVETSWQQIRNLKKILDKFDLRLSIVGLLFFNAFLLWDVRQIMALNDWRKKNRDHLALWFELVAEMEVLNSLSSLHFNHPQWCFPIITEEHFHLNGEAIGHPLIAGSQLVSSDFNMKGIPKIALVTGSNMAGKSTFLRSLGVNLVLAQTGAVVCARRFEFSPVQLMSSMRIADNLAENTSTFYAELKKLKTIIEAVNNKEKVFILLDEILRGTNSYDRHLGSAALIDQLVKEEAVAVIATHDVELASMKDKYRDQLENYHFDVQVEGEELYFDYKLKHGVCKSLNASILMKKIGIRL